MRKLMIITAVALSACAVNAASWTWTATASSNAPKNFYTTPDGGSSYVTMANATGWTFSDAFLFDNSVVSRVAVLTALNGALNDPAKDVATVFAGLESVKSATFTSNKMNAPTAFEYGETDANYNFYMSVLAKKGDDYMVLFSDTTGNLVGMDTGKTGEIKFDNPGSGSTSSDGWTKAYYADASTVAESGNAGWYALSASTPEDPSGGVPEPTSGLLMLVGLAGLALRRKLA